MNKRLTTEQLEAIRKNAVEASGLNFYAWTVTQAVENDIPLLLAEVARLHEENEILREDYGECERHLEGMSEQSERFYEKYRNEKRAKARSESKLKAEIARLQSNLKEAESIALWSARRLPATYRPFIYDEIDKLFGGKAERL